MAHDIFQDRRMFFSGATPWHGLGTQLPANATWEQARDAAGFYNVVERQVFAAGVPQAVPDVKALIASDDGRYLSTVGADYGVVQFSDMAKAVIEAAGGVQAVFHTGGLLGERGQKGWLLGELPLDLTIGGKDPLKAYFLAYSGHDGRTPVTLANCATRVVCANTVAAALGERGGFRTSIRHTSNAAGYVSAAADGFSTLRESYLRLQAWGERAAARRLTADEATEVLNRAHPEPVGGVPARVQTKHERIEAIHSKILDLYEAHEVPETKGTAWAMFNAVQGFAEHFAPTRAKLQLADMNPSTRAAMIAERSFFGAGASGGQAALEAVIAATGLPHPSAMRITA